MKKALVLGALVSLGALSFGCALTDYDPAPGQSPFVGLNKTHGVIGCWSDDRFANTQQTLEAQSRNLLYTSTFGGPSLGGNCVTGFNPGVTSTNVSGADAKDWNRFNGPWVFFGEAQVNSYGYSGTYMLAGVKDLADGSRRINNYYAPAFNFTCVGSAVDGVYGAPEGTVVGDGLVNPGKTAARLPGLRLDSMAIDHAPTTDFCPNLAAVDPVHATQGFSTYWGLLARAYEGRVRFSPVTRRDGQGLSDFFNGGSVTATIQGVTVTLSGHLNADGTVRATLQKLESNGVVYQAGDHPLYFDVNLNGGGRAVKVFVTDRSELVNVAHFALDAGLTGRSINLGGQFVPELGITLPNAALMLNGDAMQQFINNATGGTDGLGG